MTDRVGGDVAETGSGPGSFDPTDGLVWHLTYGASDPLGVSLLMEEVD